MNDPRLIEWLALARRALDAEGSEVAAALDAEGSEVAAALDAEGSEVAAVLDELAEGRQRLQTSLAADPPAEPPTLDLARELAEIERRVQELASGALADLGTKLEDLHRVRSGTRGYRAARSDRATFVSRNV